MVFLPAPFARLLAAVVLVLACSWNAPHDNPLDPSVGGSIEGRVLTRRATPIAGALVSIPQAGRFCSSDSAGGFFLLGLPAESVKLVVSAEDYAPETSGLSLAKGRIDSVVYYLNGLPYFEGCSLTTHVHDRSWPPEPLRFASLSCVASDLDGAPDVESVWVEIPDLGCSSRLGFDPNRGRYAQTLYAGSIPGQSLDSLVGKGVFFRVLDKEGAEGDQEEVRVSRIISDLPVQLFPAGGLDTVATDTNFVWNRFDLGYWVTYYAEVVRIEGGGPSSVVASFEIDRPEDTTFRLNHSLLAPGDYYWTVEVLDAFGNSSRASEELFHAR